MFDFRLTLRNFFHDRNYALINILSLAVTISCSLILLSYILIELDYDKHYQDHERIYRIATELQRGGSSNVAAPSARVLGPYLQAEYPQLIEDYVRFKSIPVAAYAYDDLERDWGNVWFADETVFSVFSHEILYGDPQSALVSAQSIAVSESFSRFYFGEANPIGNVIKANGGFYEVSLVFRDLPDSTHLKYNALLSANGEEEMREAMEAPYPGGITGLNVLTYMKLEEGQNKQTFESHMADFYSRIEASTLAPQMETKLIYHAQPLASIHYDNGNLGDQPTGNINNLYAFAAILIALIIVSSANYTNLAIAKSMKNARQIGVSKILGARGYQLSIRLLLESMIYGLLALLLGLFAIELIEMLTPLASIFGRVSLYDVTQDPELFVWSLGVVLLISLLASAYPAFYLSSVSPLVSLNVSGRAASSRIPLQRTLLGLQLFISVAILSTTLLMAVQINYLLDKPLGAEYEDLINVKLRGTEAVFSSPEIVNELKANTNIIQASSSSYVLGEQPQQMTYRIENEAGNFNQSAFMMIRADSNFIPALGLGLLNGRNFLSSTLPDNDNSVIVNQALVRQQGWNNPIGKRLASPIEGDSMGDKVVIGVIEDFHVTSLHTEIAPLAIFKRNFADFDRYSLDEGEMVRDNLIVKVADENTEQALSLIESTIAQFSTSYTFDYEFVEEKVGNQYLTELHQMSLFGVFAGVSIFLSCLGFFGLIAFSLERRSKELSMRRIVGATILQLNNLLAKEYFYLILIVAVPASLVSYLVIQDWLSLFSYYTEVKIWIFAFSVAVIGVLSYSAISFKLLSLANSRLADNLRYE